jgi:hypothetical protein
MFQDRDLLLGRGEGNAGKEKQKQKESSHLAFQSI